MRASALVLIGAAMLQHPLVPVDVPMRATGRVVVRGDEQFVTRHIDGVFDVAMRRRVNGRWQDVQVLFTAPRGVAIFLSSLSPDGRRLYVETNLRTPPVQGREDTDAWVMDRSPEGWTPPRPLGTPWDTDANEHAMTTAATGLVCMNSARPGGVGENDLYCSPGLSSAPVVVRTLSSTAEDAFATVSTSGDVIVFASNRPGGAGGFDLYAARRDGSDWTAPVNLGAPINSPDDELHPWLDDDTLIFVRTTADSRSVLAQRGWMAPAATR